MKNIIPGVFLITATLAFAQVTIPNEFSDGTTISASEMNANFQALADAVNALNTKVSNPIIVSAERILSVQNIPSSIETRIVFDHEDIDTGEDYSTSSGIFSVPETGTYFVSTTVGVQTNSTNYIRIYINLNGTPMASSVFTGNGTEVIWPQNLSYTIEAEAGNEIDISVLLNGSTSVINAPYSQLTIFKLD